MSLLIGLTGKAGAGKDTVGNYLKANHNFQLASFAAPLKEGVKVMFGLDNTYLEHPLKEEIIPDIEKSPRQLMQLLGTEYGRNLVHQNLWLILAKKKINEYFDLGYNVCITDCRFDNEAEMITQDSGYIIEVRREESGTKFVHPSEAGISPSLVDITIENNRSLEELYRGIDDVMGKLRMEDSANGSV
jgi:dephospho-CoA kinase